MKRIKQLLEALRPIIIIVSIVAVFAGVLGSACLRGEAVENFRIERVK